jgi:nicotinamidase-related amidase
MGKNALLIIDPQYDFCNPHGALFVDGADLDMERLSVFIRKNEKKIDKIFVSMDSHPLNAIYHSSFWSDSEGYPPLPFTQITHAQVAKGVWKPKNEQEKVLKYLAALEEQGEFPHLIWPTHCLTGSKGASIEEVLMKAIRAWSERGRDYRVIMKGTYPLTEHFGIFMAQIPDPERKETTLDTALLKELDEYDTIYLAGEARSHCVGTSLKQLMLYAPEIANKIILITDCMSDVQNLGYLADPIYAEAEKRGIRKVEHSHIIQ